MPPSYRRQDHHFVIERHSRPFRDSRPDGEYWPRVQLEALFRSRNRESLGKSNTEFDNRWNFQLAEWDLRTRREIVFPIVGAPKQVPTPQNR